MIGAIRFAPQATSREFKYVYTSLPGAMAYDRWELASPYYGRHVGTVEAPGRDGPVYAFCSDLDLVLPDGIPVPVTNPCVQIVPSDEIVVIHAAESHVVRYRHPWQKEDVSKDWAIVDTGWSPFPDVQRIIMDYWPTEEAAVASLVVPRIRLIIHPEAIYYPVPAPGGSKEETQQLHDFLIEILVNMGRFMGKGELEETELILDGEAIYPNKFQRWHHGIAFAKQILKLMPSLMNHLKDPRIPTSHKIQAKTVLRIAADRARAVVERR